MCNYSCLWRPLVDEKTHQPFLHRCVSLQRPTAKELLKHKFIVKHCKKTSYLSDLIDRYRRWKEAGHSDNSSEDSDRWAAASRVKRARLKRSRVTLARFVPAK